MPYNEDILPHGGLQDWLKPIAEQLTVDLKEGRRAGRSGPKKPAKADVLCAYYNELYAAHLALIRKKLTDVHIRAIVQYLRDLHLPICSLNSGYYWGETVEEINLSLLYLKPKRDALSRAINNLEKAAKKVTQVNLFEPQPGDHLSMDRVTELMRRELGAEMINQ